MSQNNQHEWHDRVIIEGCKTLAPIIGGPLGLGLIGLAMLGEVSTHLDKKKEADKPRQTN